MVWLGELAAGVSMCLGGIGLWALPEGTPVIGRPPVLVGWACIIFGAVMVVVSILNRFGLELRAPVGRRITKASETVAVPVRDRTPLPEAPRIRFVSPAAPKPERMKADVTLAEVKALGETPNLTNAERNRLLAPHVGKWFNIIGKVMDVNPGRDTLAQVVLEADGGAEVLAYFSEDMERVGSLRKGSALHILGKFTGAIGHYLNLEDCEIVS
jgi:hypothetical protein